MSVKLKQVKGSTFAAIGNSGHWVMMDADKRFLGENGASRPMELVLMALGGCTAIDVVTILNKMKVSYTDFQLRIFNRRAQDHPKVFTKIALKYAFWGNNLPLEKIEKAVNLSRDKYCSVSAMLSSTAEITHEILLNPSPEILEKDPLG